MQPRSYGTGGPQLPSLRDWQRNLLIILFVAYVAELIAQNMGAPVYTLALWGFDGAFGWWQPLTHYLVQGPGVPWVLLSLFILYLILPTVTDRFGSRELAEAMGAGALGGVVVALAGSALGLFSGPAMGWTVLVMALFVLFGLGSPNANILLFFVLPIQASWVAWGSGVFAVLQLLAQPGLGSLEALGVWIGTVAWFFLRGPGARRRNLVRRRDEIQNELGRFRVIDGGRSGPQGDQDDVVH